MKQGCVGRIDDTALFCLKYAAEGFGLTPSKREKAEKLFMKRFYRGVASVEDGLVAEPFDDWVSYRDNRSHFDWLLC